MSSRHRTALVWRSGPSLGQTDLERCIDAAGERVAGGVRVYFRADDVAVPGRRFQRMMELFAARRAPLSLAMVPAWLTPGRWRQVSAAASRLPELWCWHQHGWRHTDHEPAGKKQEFGPARPAGALRFDISRGRARLESILGRHFYPVFTPPWNRCGGDALRILTELGFAAVSRSRGAQPPAPAGLPEVAVDVDLHTRRDADPGAGWRSLLAEIAATVAGGGGIMLHHQRMNDRAFGFLDLLLAVLASRPAIELVNFRDLLGEK
jgi:hypothetical protein